jgi:hypothetical protein
VHVARLALLALLVGSAGCLGGAPIPNVDATFVDASDGWATLTFTYSGAPQGLGVELVAEHHRRLDEVVPVRGHNEVLLGFLHGDTEYSWTLRAIQSGAVLAEGAFRTLSDPYPWSGPDEATVRPGVAIMNATCTLGFVLRDETNASVYALTAGHCVESVGQPVTVDEVRRFGVVVAFEDGSDGGADWALVRVDTAHRNATSPSVLHWTGPGTPEPELPGQGETVCLYGWGGTGSSSAPRARCGPVVESAPGDTPIGRIRYDIDTQGGDSGGPVIIHETGAPVAIHATANPIRKGAGHRVDFILEEIEASHGLRLEVSTAAYVTTEASE